MGVTVGVNNLSVVHAGSSGTTIAFPDVCKTPSPAGPVPIPYPNLAGPGQQNTTASKAPSAQRTGVFLKDSNFSISAGDEAGAAMGAATLKLLRGQQLRGQLQILHLQMA